MVKEKKFQMETTARVKEVFTVTKYKNDEDYRKGKAYQVLVDIFESDINCLLNAGITLMLQLIAGISATHYDEANAQIGVGDKAGDTWQASTAYSLGDVVEPTTPDDNVYECTTAGTSGGTEPTWVTGEGNTTNDGTVVWTCHTKVANAAQDDLVGKNTSWVAMDANFPEVSNQKITFQGTYGDGVAQFAWQECVVRQAGTGTTAINRVVADKGTKSSGEIWIAKDEITIT